MTVLSHFYHAVFFEQILSVMQNQNYQARLFYLGLIAFSSDAIVMALEITGSRVLTPVFGSSTTTWGILIGIILTGLAVGYFLGGRISDSKPSVRRLCSVMFSTGLFVLFIPFISQPLIEFFIKVTPNFSAATFFSTLFIFGLPAILLGFVSPYAIKLAATTLHKIGTIAGNLYSVSTLGSIFGTFLTVFALIPFFEINHLIFAFGFILMAASSVGLGKVPKVMIGILVVVFAGSMVMGAEGMPPYSNNTYGSGSEILFEKETIYSSLAVTEKNNSRTMYIDGTTQSRMDLDDPSKLVVYYTKSFHLTNLINPQLEEMLFVGGGGFSGPKSFLANYDGITRVDVVEIDPDVIDAAKKYFFVPKDPRLEIINEDARVFLTQTDRKYDAIILDAYSGYEIPFHLMTKQFYEILDERLSNDGIIVSNFIGTLQGQNSKLFQSNHKTLQEIFPNVFVFPTNIKDTDHRQNITIIALKDEDTIKFGSIAHLQPECEMQKIIECEKFFENYYPNSEIKNEDINILTDQLSPVNSLDESPSSPTERSQINQESKIDAANATGFVLTDYSLQISLIIGVVVWGYDLQRIWKKH